MRLSYVSLVVLFFISLSSCALSVITKATVVTPTADPNTALNRVVLTDPNAKCLDGTQYSYYISVGSEATKFYINHQGGGWCQDLNECAERAKTVLGSSANWTATSVQGDSFSRDPTINPLMATWTLIYLPYCDGGSFTGNATSPNSPLLYFHGLPIREISETPVSLFNTIPTIYCIIIFDIGNAVVASLRSTYNFDSATDLVIGGCSAGGLAAYLHVDWYGQQVPKATTRGLPDSGFFLDGNYSRDGKPDYEARMSNLYQFMGSAVSINPECNSQLGYKCLFAYHLIPFLKSPFLALNSEYDATMGDGQCGHSGIIFNWNNVSSVNACGAYITGLFKSLAVAPSAVFLDSCQHHCGEWGQIHIDNLSSPFAVQLWYEKGAGALPNDGFMAQGQTYPCTACCND